MQYNKLNIYTKGVTYTNTINTVCLIKIKISLATYTIGFNNNYMI